MYARNRKSGIAIAGTLERLSGVANINANSFKPGEDGKLAFEYSGWTEVHWNAQRTATDEHERTLYVDDDGDVVTVEDIELTETAPRGEGAAFAPARKTGREVLGDERAIALWGSLKAVPSCPVCACHGPEGDGDASNLDLTTNADAYALCDGCRMALREADEPTPPACGA